MQIWRGPFGLRGRIVGAVLITTVVTLVVAAVALLGPLETKLRSAEFITFKREVPASVARPFTGLDIGLAAEYPVTVLPVGSHSSPQEQRAYRDELALQVSAAEEHSELLRKEADLLSPIGASEVAVLDEVGGQPHVIARFPSAASINELRRSRRRRRDARR